jgi:hypothetical protein
MFSASNQRRSEPFAYVPSAACYSCHVFFTVLIALLTGGLFPPLLQDGCLDELFYSEQDTVSFSEIERWATDHKPPLFFWIEELKAQLVAVINKQGPAALRHQVQQDMTLVKQKLVKIKIQCANQRQTARSLRKQSKINAHPYAICRQKERHAKQADRHILVDTH